tara:strand:+ start:487 stop:909 length:423 start_codon:yes stop_codon:yes gene_type:complete
MKINVDLNLFIIIINILFFIYFSIQLLVFTDEFALNNLGFFNHAIAGLCEILGIIFFSFSIGLIISIYYNYHKQEPFFYSIVLIQLIISINLWRYVFTNSPGETDIKTISFNASIFSFFSITMIILIYRLKRLLKNMEIK